MHAEVRRECNDQDSILPQGSHQIDYTKHLLCAVGLGQDKKWESFQLVCQEQVINLQRESVGKEKPDVPGIDWAER